MADNDGMRPAEHLRWLATERAAFGAVLDAGDLSAPVPGCPGWDLRELAAHLGAVHRWAGTIVRTGRASSDHHPAPDGRSALVDWFEDGGAALQRTLDAADPDERCWTFAPPHVAAFWMRRQAHETSLHRWDAQSSQGVPEPIDPALAADGVAELVDMFFPRQVRLGRQPPLTASLRIEVAGGGTHTLTGDGSDRAADRQPANATLAGPAEAVLLLLWGRATLEDPRVSVAGSRDAADRVLGARISP